MVARRWHAERIPLRLGTLSKLFLMGRLWYLLGMTTKKLSRNQVAVLAHLSTNAAADYYALQSAGAGGGNCTNTLTKLGLLVQNGDKKAGKTWSITDAGRAALAAGRYPLTGK